MKHRTTEYRPDKYWEMRAQQSKGDLFKAVCTERSFLENAAMHSVQAKVFHSFLKHLNLKGAYVLEFGCGAGRWAPLIIAKGGKYFGVDIAPTMIEHARSRVPQGLFFRINGKNLPFQDKSFDLVFSITVIHHNPYDQQQHIISEMTRVLKPGGYFFLLEAVSHGTSHKTWFNTWARTPEDWINAVCKNGECEVVKIQFIRYLIFKDAMLKIARLTHIPVLVNTMKNSPLLNRLLLTISKLVDGYVVRVIPKNKATAIAILFRKKEKV